MKTLQQLAREASGYMETSTRPDGSTFWRTADNCPEWVSTLVHSAHGDMLPDDYRYRWTAHALEAFSRSDEPETVLDYLEADPYNFDLLSWVSSNLYRMAWVDEAMEEGATDNLAQALSWGQLKEIREVYYSVLESLVTELEELKEEEA